MTGGRYVSVSRSKSEASSPGSVEASKSIASVGPVTLVEQVTLKMPEHEHVVSDEQSIIKVY